MTSIDTNRITILTIYDEIAEFILSAPTTEQIANFHLSDMTDHYISDLLEANRTRGLTLEEKAVLEDYSRIEYLMQAVKVRAFAKIDRAKREQA